MAEHDSVIPPGGSGTLTATLKTKPTQNGRLSKSISVVTDAGDAPNIRLRFSVDVHAPIVVRPSFRLNVTAITGTASSARVLLHRADGQPLKVGKVTLDRPDLVVRVRPVSGKAGAASETKEEGDLWSDMASRRHSIEAEAGDAWIELAVKPTAPAGTKTGTLLLTTNDPDASEMSLPYSVRVRPLIEARPGSVRLWPAPEGSPQGRSAIVTLRQTMGGEFAVTGVEVSNPEIFTAVANTTAMASRQALRVNLADGLEPDKMVATVVGWIKVHTDEAGQAVVEIPVVVAPTRALAVRRPPRTVAPSNGLKTLER